MYPVGSLSNRFPRHSVPDSEASGLSGSPLNPSPGDRVFWVSWWLRSGLNRELFRLVMWWGAICFSGTGE